MIHLFHWLQSISGVTDIKWYNWWSGFWGGITVFSIFSILINQYRHHKCATCWRIGRHLVEGTTRKTCHKHYTSSHHAKIERDYSERYPEQHRFIKWKKTSSN